MIPAARTPPRAATGSLGGARRGFTLLEVLIAAGLSALLGVLLLGATRGGAAVREGVTARADASGRAATARALVRLEVEVAGRGQEQGGLRWIRGGAGAYGDLLRLRYLRDAWRNEPKEEHLELFAARDGAGRPNLYRRPVGAVRQPLVLGVDGMRVTGAVTADGRTLHRAQLYDGVRVHALQLELRTRDGAPLAFTVVPRYANSLAVGEAP